MDTVSESIDLLDVYLEDKSVDELKKLVKTLAWNPGFGCCTKTGFEELVWPAIKDKVKWLLFFDIDGMKALNSMHASYDPVDAMIYEVLKHTRNKDIKAGQLNSGDEMIIAILEDETREEPLDPEGLVGRLVQEFGKQNMSATFAVVPVISDNLRENIKPAVDKVLAIKAQRGWTQK